MAENAREEGGYGKFVLLDIPRGNGGGRGGLKECDAEFFFSEACEEERRPTSKDWKKMSAGGRTPFRDGMGEDEDSWTRWKGSRNC